MQEKINDPEIDAMGTLNTILSNLQPEMQTRVLKWANSKFNVASAIPLKSSSVTLADSGVKPSEFDMTNYKDLADFIDATNPKKDYEVALVTAYYLQKQNGHDLTGFEINSALKNLGRRIGNITNAIGMLMIRKPSLAIQASKSGTSTQAKKKYRITTEGEREVIRMFERNAISNGGNE